MDRRTENGETTREQDYETDKPTAGQPSTDVGLPSFAAAVEMDQIKLQVASMPLQDSTNALRGNAIQCDTPPLPSMPSFD
ncbi:unnamed protein product [Symbiodinium sp. CCMP2592]|nr:unnamed protein product [Symbiodinium sp. CCMP2592]